MRPIDSKSKRIVSIIRQSETQDSSGDYGTTSETTIKSNIIADIQPLSGNINLSQSGAISSSTHLAFFDEYFITAQIQDVVRDDSVDYEITFIADFEDHNEFYLRKL